MQFSEGSFYHIYNRGNNKQPIFFQERNYDFFIEKFKKYISIHNHVLAWCLMPNHFHILIQANAPSSKIIKQQPVEVNATSEGIRLLLSSYTKAIQKQESFTGNLFQQKTKAKCVDEYASIAFHYIHQNPMKANLVDRMEEWKWSSLPEYLGRAPENICNRELAFKYFDLNKDNFLTDSYSVTPYDIQKLI